MLRLYEPTEGQILLNGVDISEAQHIADVCGEYDFADLLSVLEKPNVEDWKIELISDYEAKIEKNTLDNAVELALAKAEAKNTTAVKAVMSDFLASAKLEGDTVKGLDEAIAKVKESDGYLFNSVSSDKNPKGHTPKGDMGGSPDKTPRSVFEARLAEAKTNKDNVAAIMIKQEASAQGISLL